MGEIKEQQGIIHWKSKVTLALVALFCCVLWGSAFPSIKMGYRLFDVQNGEAATQILFAGCRFFLAGLLTLLFGSLLAKKPLLPRKSAIKPILVLASTQTVGQYLFFYMGLAHAAASRSSIISSSGTFINFLFAAYLFRSEKMTVRKAVGCLIGFAGVVIVQTAGQSVGAGFVWNGEGFLLIAAVSGSLATNFIKKFGARENPVMLSGFQFALGGLVMMLVGFVAGGRLHPESGWSWSLILYLAFVSAAAYTLWGVLLKYHPVSLVSIFQFAIPCSGVFLSAIILGETQTVFHLYVLVSLLLVCAGIVIIFGTKPERKLTKSTL